MRPQDVKSFKSDKSQFKDVFADVLKKKKK